jgi:Glycosyl hydrolases family 2, sugar binding domain.
VVTQHRRGSKWSGWSRWLLLATLGLAHAFAASPLEEGFDHPPLSARPLGWWHWINGHVTKEGIAADLEAAKRAGMGGVQLFDVEMYLPPGPVRYGTDDWYSHVRYAMQKAAELGLEFHVMNTPGWSASGGPWVTPERSMKRVVWSETSTHGGKVSPQLPLPDLTPAYHSRTVAAQPFYRDIAVFAVPATAERLPDFEKKSAWGSRPLTRTLDINLPGIAPEQVLNLTANLDATGHLTADLPPGKWTLLRIGFTTTGKTNHPAVKEGHGLEIDKLDADAVTFQFEQALGRLLKEAGPLAGTTFNALLFDSFEGGFQNWTESLPEAFRTQKGYDLTPWLPVLTGRVIGSVAETEVVLWDFRAVIEELIAENYYGTMHRLAAKHGLKIYSESQGGPITPMSANRHVDVPMNEFWTPDATARASKIKMTTSSASFRGRSVIAAEAFTSTPENGKYQNTPATLKRSGDYAFTLGLNRFALHSFTHQPVTELAPGFALGRYGVHFGRLNTWWPYADAWMSYLSRSQFLLQQGRVVSDVCLLVDEDLGYALPPSLADALPGYDYEVAYPNQVREMTVRDGTLVHPSGLTFRVLVTPGNSTGKDWVAELSTLRHLKKLVAAGAVLAGKPPVAPAGWSDQKQRAEFDHLVAEIWGDATGTDARVHRVGAGKVYPDLPLIDLLRAENIPPDVSWGASDSSVKFIHRATSDANLYFVFNNSAQARRVMLEFRQNGRTPEIWDPISGTRREAPMFERTKAGTAVPVDFEAWGSAFVIFRKPLPRRWVTSADPVSLEFKSGPLTTKASNVTVHDSDGCIDTLKFHALPSPQILAGPWVVAFRDGRRAPAQTTFPRLVSWTEHTDAGIRFYSGTAVYGTEFTTNAIQRGQIAVLDLGQVADIARVFLNGREIGVLWQPPFRANVTSFLREGANQLEIHVANRWINRLIGDEAIAPGFRYQKPGRSKFTDGRLLTFPDWLYDPSKRANRPRVSFSTWQHYDADSPLVPAGLLGPVKLEWLHEIELH